MSFFTKVKMAESPEIKLFIVPETLFTINLSNIFQNSIRSPLWYR
jgi:hypothetical protein